MLEYRMIKNEKKRLEYRFRVTLQKYTYTIRYVKVCIINNIMDDIYSLRTK